MNKELKTAKQIERHIKGIANHWRIEILFLVVEREELSVDRIAKILKCNVKTVSEHTRRLVQAGLINKQYRGREVIHTTSPYGKILYTFLKTFQHS